MDVLKQLLKYIEETEKLYSFAPSSESQFKAIQRNHKDQIQPLLEQAGLTLHWQGDLESYMVALKTLKAELVAADNF